MLKWRQHITHSSTRITLHMISAITLLTSFAGAQNTTLLINLIRKILILQNKSDICLHECLLTMYEFNKTIKAFKSYQFVKTNTQYCFSTFLIYICFTTDTDECCVLSLDSKYARPFFAYWLLSYSASGYNSAIRLGTSKF